MNWVAPRLRMCCHAQQRQRALLATKPHQHLSSVACTAAGRVPNVESSQALSQCCLYLVDLVPMIYKYLPRDETATAPMVPQQQARATEMVTDPAESLLGALLALTKRDSAAATHMALAVDVPGASHRHRMYHQYKAHRSHHPPELTTAIRRTLAVVDALGIPVLTVPGVEADDVIGTLAARAQQDGFKSVIIVSPDKDFYQLLSPTVSIMTRTNQPLYTLRSFQQQQQLSDPKLWVDVKALMGDPSDNIPGVRSIGQKTAHQLVQSLGTVEHIIQQLHSMTEEEQRQVVKLNKPQRAMLLSEEGQHAAAFMKMLVTINTSLKAPPCQQPWSSFEMKMPADEGKLALEYAQKLGMDWLFYRLQDHFAKLTTPSSSQPVA